MDILGELDVALRRGWHERCLKLGVLLVGVGVDAVSERLLMRRSNMATLPVVATQPSSDRDSSALWPSSALWSRNISTMT
jgi:hypothetical protein